MEYIYEYAVEGIAVVGSGVALYYGYSYLKKKIAAHIFNQVHQKFGEIQDNEDEMFKSLERSQSALISFTHGGKKHFISVPYDRRKGRTMTRKKVYLVKDGEKIEITHKQGIPYLLSAEEMGGSSILVIKDNKLVKEYSSETRPNYLED